MPFLTLGDTRLKIPEGLSREEKDSIVDDYTKRRMKEAGVLSPQELAQVNAAERQKKGRALTQSMSEWDRQRAATVAGMANLGRGVGNMLGLVSDEDVTEAQERDRPLAEAEKFSHLAGEVLPGALLPGSTLPRAVASGAAYGGAVAKPGERRQGAARGALLGGGISALTRSLGRTGSGLVKSTPEARRLQRAGVETPITQAADEASGGISAMAGPTYRHFVRFFPTSRAALDTQMKRLATQGPKTVAAADVTKHGVKLADDLAEVLGKAPPKESNIYFRNWFYEVGNFLGGAAEVLPLPVVRGAASVPFQNFLLGSTKWQHALQTALRTNNRTQVVQALEDVFRAYTIAEGGENAER